MRLTWALIWAERLSARGYLVRLSPIDNNEWQIICTFPPGHSEAGRRHGIASLGSAAGFETGPTVGPPIPWVLPEQFRQRLT